MRSATDILRDEHRLILRALTSLEQALQRLASGIPLPDGLWDELVAWLRAFADHNHHTKEEEALFPAILRAGVPADGGPIEVMLAEHAEGRRLLRAMETGPAGERADAAGATSACCAITSTRRTTCCSRSPTRCSTTRPGPSCCAGSRPSGRTPMPRWPELEGTSAASPAR